MKYQKPQLILGLCLLAVLIVLAGAAAMFFGPTGKVNLSAAMIPADAIGSDWSGPSGMVVNDFQASSKSSAEELKIITFLQSQLAPAGVVGAADFAYRQKANPLAQIAIKIYVFQTPELCRKWVQEKYQAPGWEATYKKVAKPGCLCFDALAGKKRIAATGRVLIMADSQAKSEVYLKLLDLYLRRLW